MNEHFSALPVFVSVVETGSFSAASDKLNITKSAVSKRISVLEDSLGVRLFNRTTRKLTLTEAGERFADYARNAVMMADQGIAAVTQFQGKPKGVLKINAPMTFCRLHIVPFIKEFLETYPDIKVILSMDDHLVDMVEGGFDISIRIGELKDSSLIAKKLTDCVSVVCASPAYLTAHGEPKTPEELSKHNCIYYSLFQAGVEWSFLHNQQKHKVQPTGNFVVNNSDVILKVLLQGMGICQMPTFIVNEHLKNGNLVTILDDYALPEHAIYAVYPERKHLPEKVRVFIDYLNTKLGGGTGYWDK